MPVRRKLTGKKKKKKEKKTYGISWSSEKEQCISETIISSTCRLYQSILSVCTKKYPPSCSYSIKPFQTRDGVTCKVLLEGKYRLTRTPVCSNSPASIHLVGALLCICLHICMNGGLENICPARSGQPKGHHFTALQLGR